MPSPTTDRLAGTITSVAVKPPICVATTAAITLSGLQTIDGVALAAGDRVLVKNQNSALDNGIYVAGAGDWERALDFDGSYDAVGGTQLYVTDGTVNGNSYWRVAGSGAKIAGADAITFEAGLLSDAAGISYTPEGVSVSAIISTLRSGSLGRGVPADDVFDWLPIRITGATPSGLVYSDEPVNAAYRLEESDGQFSTDAVWCAPKPVGDDTLGDGTPGAPYESVDKAFTASTATNIHLLQAADGSRGDYDDWSLRYDSNPDGCAKLRVLISHGRKDQPITFKSPCDDISLDAVAGGWVGIDSGENIEDGDTVVIAGNTITFKDTPTGPLDIALVGGEERLHWALRLVSCINANSSTLGVTATYIPFQDGDTLVIVLLKANTPGSGGNSITLSVTSTHSILSRSAATLTGGGDGWTFVANGVWSYQTTDGYAFPRAVINHAVREPNTGQPKLMPYYGNCRRITFSGQPSAGDYFENTSGYQGLTRRLTFAASGVGAYDENTLLGTVVLGATLADTLANFVTVMNANALYFGLVADATATVVRTSVRLNSNPTISATVSGATMSLSSQSPGSTELETLALTTTDNLPFAALTAGGWAFNESNLKLYVKLPGGVSVQTYKFNMELLAGTASNRCFLFGGRIGFLGAFQWRGSFLFGSPANDEDVVDFPTRVWATFTNDADTPVGFVSPIDNGLFELSGIQSVIQGATGYCTTIDTYHFTTDTDSGVGPKSQVIKGGSEFAGDPFTFPVNEFPNRNTISPHGITGSTAIFEFRGNRSVGPLVVGEGSIWMVDVQGKQSWGLGSNQFGLYGLTGGTYYVDNCAFSGNTDADVTFLLGTNNIYRLGYRTILGSGTPFIPPAA